MNGRAPHERLLRTRLAALARMLPAARRGDVNGVHKARVATRRLRETLPIVLAEVPARKSAKLKKRFRRLTRTLGPVRELDVTLGLLAALRQDRHDAAEALGWVERELAVERARSFEAFQAAFERTDIRRSGERALALSVAGDPAVARDVVLRGRRRLAKRVQRRTRALAAAVEAAGAMYAPEPLHAVRIAIKQLRYALELAYDMGALHSRRPITRLKADQEALGQLHDLQVLVQRIERVQGGLPRTQRHLAAQLGPVIELLETRCRERHAEYLADRETLVATTQEAERIVSAATRPARRRPPARRTKR